MFVFAPAVGHGFNKDLKAPGETWRVQGGSGCSTSALHPCERLLPFCSAAVAKLCIMLFFPPLFIISWINLK